MKELQCRCDPTTWVEKHIYIGDDKKNGYVRTWGQCNCKSYDFEPRIGEMGGIFPREEDLDGKVDMDFKRVHLESGEQRRPETYKDYLQCLCKGSPAFSSMLETKSIEDDGTVHPTRTASFGNNCECSGNDQEWKFDRARVFTTLPIE